MKPSWCASLPLVSVPQSDQPKAVTLVYPYYENPQFLRTQVARWWTYPDHVRKHISAIICDDSSPIKPAGCVLNRLKHPFPIRLFRNTGPDIPWNWIGARNRGAYEAHSAHKSHESEMWLLMTDMDHILPPTTAEALIYGNHDPKTVYAFSRIEGCDNARANTKTGDRIPPHSASFFMTGEMFWRIGGYDERFSGHYGSDGPYRRRLKRLGLTVNVLMDRLVRYERQGDSSTTAYERKKPEDSAAVRAIEDSLSADTPPLVLTFPYVEVPL